MDLFAIKKIPNPKIMCLHRNNPGFIQGSYLAVNPGNRDKL